MIDARAVLAFARLPVRAFGARGHAGVFAIFALLLAASLRLPALDASERFALVERASLAGGLFLSAVVLAFFGASAFASEFEDRVGFFVFPKPARRAAAFLGKALGLLWVLAIWTAGFALLGGAALAAVRATADGDRPPGIARSLEYPAALSLLAPRDRDVQLFLAPGNVARFEGRMGPAAPARLSALRLSDHGHGHGPSEEAPEADPPSAARIRWLDRDGRAIGSADLRLAAGRGASPGEYEPCVSEPFDVPPGAEAASLEWAETNEVLRLRAASLAGPSGKPLFARLRIVLGGEGFTWLPDETTGAEARWVFPRPDPGAESLSARFRIGGFGSRALARAEADGRGGRPVQLLDDREIPLRLGSGAGAAEAVVRLSSRGDRILVERKSVFRIRATGSYAWNYALAWGMTYAHAAVLACLGLLFGAIARPGMAALLASVPLVFTFVAGFARDAAGGHSHGPPDLVDRISGAVEAALGRAFEASASLDPGRFLGESLRIPAAALLGTLGIAGACVAAALAAGALAIGRRRLD